MFFISSGLKEIHFGSKLKNQGIVATAKVLSVHVRVSTDDDGDDTYYYTPTVEFRADDNLSYKETLKETTYKYRQHSNIEIIHFPGEPSSVQHNHYKSLYGGGVGTIILTLIFSIIVMFMIFNKK